MAVTWKTEDIKRGVGARFPANGAKATIMQASYNTGVLEEQFALVHAGSNVVWPHFFSAGALVIWLNERGYEKV